MAQTAELQKYLAGDGHFAMSGILGRHLLGQTPL